MWILNESKFPTFTTEQRNLVWHSIEYDTMTGIPALTTLLFLHLKLRKQVPSISSENENNTSTEEPLNTDAMLYVSPDVTRGITEHQCRECMHTRRGRHTRHTEYTSLAHRLHHLAFTNTVWEYQSVRIHCGSMFTTNKEVFLPPTWEQLTNMLFNKRHYTICWKLFFKQSRLFLGSRTNFSWEYSKAMVSSMIFNMAWLSKITFIRSPIWPCGQVGKI